MKNQTDTKKQETPKAKKTQKVTIDIRKLEKLETTMMRDGRRG
jgi:hypothetical protein